MELFHQETASGGWVANLVPEVRGGENMVLKISLPSFGKMVFKQPTETNLGGGRMEGDEDDVHRFKERTAALREP